MKTIVFMGKQGSGKGTQAELVSEKLGLQHISTGDLFRRLEGELKKQVDEYVNAGKLVPDELTLEILKNKIDSGVEKGIILDGFPRNINQAKLLDKEIDIDIVIEISISDETALKRLSGRWNCSNCGRIYNYNTEPKPKVKGVCDKCGGKLSQRKDDTEEAIKERLQIYHKQTQPVLEFYKDKLIKIDGEQSIEKAEQEILNILR